eukprot:2467824-Amphidinium_carterae.1
MSHGEETFRPAPAACVASTHMGPRVLGFANPGHRFPPRPVQPGHNSVGPARLQVFIDNKFATDLSASPIGPVQPGLSKAQFSARSFAARRSPLLAQCRCARGTHTWGQFDRDTPATPGVLRMP